jgi:hypothetical protein
MNNPNHLFSVTQWRRLVLLFMAWQLTRIWTAFAWRTILAEFSAQPGVWFNVCSGVFWFIIGGILLRKLAHPKPGLRKWLIGASAGYSVWFWSEALLLQQSRANWLFIASVNLAVLIILYIFSNYIEERGV